MQTYTSYYLGLFEGVPLADKKVQPTETFTFRCIIDTEEMVMRLPS